jgi:hypothetical protein
MRRLFIGIIILMLFATQSVKAQTSPTIEKMVVKIWPEYDKPSVLTIIDLFLSADVSLPAKITVRIPVEAGQPNSVAVRELDGQLYVLDYDSKLQGDWNELTFTTPYPEIWLEYYDPQIEINGDTRSYVYNWTGDYTVTDFKIEVQQPLTASNMTFQESIGVAQLGADGLTYFPANVGTVSEGTAFSLHMQYTKSDDTLSFSNAIAVQPSEPLSDQNKGRKPFLELLPYLLGGLGLVLILMGAFWYWQSTKNKPNASTNRRSHGSRRTQTLQHEGDAIYCHQCGKRASGSDQFCRACGTRLRIDE